MLTQIYGFTTPEDVDAVAGLDINNVGIVLDEGYNAWDAVDLDTALEIVDAVPPTMAIVALSLHTELEAIARTVQALRPVIVHLARAEAISSSVLATLRSELIPMQVMCTVPVRDAIAIDEARRLEEHSDYLLLDTAHPETGIVGATGFSHDWTLSRQIVEAVTVPVILAGGLGPENVVEAISTVQPAGVDSETRTSRPDDRRRKDVDRVRAFVQLARAHRHRSA
jgi:phosphoribosylanthranilate isomerase